MNQKENHNVIASQKTTEPEQSVVKEMILWWEKRRLIYNFLIIGFSAFVIYSFWDYPMRRTIGSKQVIIDAIVFVLGANILYTLGWGLEVAKHRLYKSKGLSNKIRWVLFVLGTLFSLIWIDVHFVLEFDVLFAN